MEDKMNVTTKRLDALKHPKKNVRIHSEQQIRELKLLIQSILTNGWTLPIVVRPDMTIIDGFHRWTVAGMEPLRSKLDGKVPVVVVKHKEPVCRI